MLERKESGYRDLNVLFDYPPLRKKAGCFVIMCLFYRQKEKTFRMTRKQVSEQSGISTRVCFNYIEQLVEMGLIEKRLVKNEAGRLRNEFTVLC